MKQVGEQQHRGSLEEASARGGDAAEGLVRELGVLRYSRDRQAVQRYMYSMRGRQAPAPSRTFMYSFTFLTCRRLQGASMSEARSTASRLA